MGKKEVFLVVLDNPQGIFYPGQTVSGRVELQLFDDLKVTAINIIFKGFAHVKWSEGGGNNRRTYTGNEKFFHEKVCLFGKQQTGKDDVKLKPDNYSYPFSFQLAKDLPSSYEAQIGRVRYTLKAHIDIPWAFDKYTKRTITVVSALDLNTIPEAKGGATQSGEKTLCCLCCKSDPVSVVVMVDRVGYVPGESIVFRAEIINKSNREMTCSYAKLVMQVSYHATTKTNKVNNILIELKHGKIEAGGTDVWMNEKMHIPALPPSYLRGCKIIDIRYCVMITVDPSGVGFDLHVPLEVIIGSIPLSSVAEQHGMLLPSQPHSSPSSQPSFEAPKGLYSSSTMPTNTPQATLVQSAMGCVNTAEDDDTKETTGNTLFAPVYTYYNWDKPDPANTFMVKCQ